MLIVKEYDIPSIVSELDFSSYQLISCGNGLLLTRMEKQILDKYHISYQSCCNLKEVLYRIDEVFSMEEASSLEDLDMVSASIAERDYYQNTNK